MNFVLNKSHKLPSSNHFVVPDLFFLLHARVHNYVHVCVRQKRGVECMMKIVDADSKKARHLRRAAQYNVARAYFQGIGLKQSDSESER